MALTEHTINDALADMLRPTRQAWRESDIVTSETTGMIKGAATRPDIVVIEPNVSPVVIETEVVPAVTVEREALSRLGAQLSGTGQAVLSVVAVRVPDRLRTVRQQSLRSEIAKSQDLEMVLFTGNSPSTGSRWPESGWLRGNIADLSVLTQAAGVPPDVIEGAANQLVDGVSESAALLTEVAKDHPAALTQISEHLRQEDGEQTRRMAATILANAFVFHEALANGPGPLADVATLDQLRGRKGGLSKTAILAEWRTILAVNYWPIFDIARRILEVIPASNSKTIIERLATTATRLLELRLMRSHDLTGAVFQRLIADRKFLAAYYTTPASAAMLIGLAIAPDKAPGGGSWSAAETVRTLRIADFACGTGTLLSTAYQRVGQLHELAGGDAEALHPEMMARALVGCDVLPAAAHLTASMLAGAHPTVRYSGSSVLTVPYGKQPDGGIALGSLDLLKDQAVLDLLDLTAKSVGAMGERETKTWSELPHASFDLVIMNPPFVRATVHEADRLNVPNPMFAAFASTGKEQRLMSEATQRLTAGTTAHGNAGEASIFLVLADRKLKVGGVLAMVMPLSLMSGESWEDSRSLLAQRYRKLVLVSIAGAADNEMSFSADTDMGECLVVCQKAPPEQGRAPDAPRATFVILNKRPSFPLLGFSAATQIERLIAGHSIARLEDGPIGGTALHFGADVIGHVLDAALPGGWKVARIADLALAQAAHQLADEGRVWLPTMPKATAGSLPIRTVGEIGEVGPIHRDINGTNPGGSIRGPFDIRPVRPGNVPTYPALWSHVASRERTLAFEGDSEAIPRHGKGAAAKAALATKVEAIWKTASHCHFNCDFRFNSQSTGMQFTPQKAIGGRAWISIQLSSIKQEKALVLFANTSLGMLLRWWHSNRQQSGRGNIGKAALQTMAILDVASLTPIQLDAADELFDDVRQRPLLAMYRLDEDPVRHELDKRFGREVLALPAHLFEADGAMALLRRKLAAEPSVRGGKAEEGETEQDEE